MSDINIVLEQRDDIHVAVEEKDINVEVPAGKDGRSLRPRGEWSASVAYAYLDLVSYEGSSYVATKAVPAGTLPTDTSYWMLSAEKGEPGGSVWGLIAGDLSDQTDLQTALDAKAPIIISSASGSIASFSDGSASPVTALSVGIEPVQDLHGYDNPWPAGGGKNIYPEIVPGTYSADGITITVGQKNLITVTGQKTTSTALTIEMPLSVPFIAKADFYIHARNSQAFSGIAFSEKKNSITLTSVNRIMQCTNDGTSAVSVCNMYFTAGTTQALNFTLQPSVEATGDATSWTPYSNVCPISGHTSAVVTRTGKNLLNPNAPVVNAYITTSNKISENSNNRTVYIPCKPNTTYTYKWNRSSISGNDDSKIIALTKYPAINDVGTLMASVSTNSGIITATFTTGANDIWLAVKVANITNSNFTETLNASQLELGSSATAYEPYQGTSVTIDLNGTRYGGVLDVLTGEMTVDRKMVTITDADYVGNVSSSSSIRIAMALPDDSMTWSSTTAISNKIICSGFKESTNELTNTGVIGFHYRANGSHNVIFSFGNNFPGATTVAEARTWIDSNPQQVVYYLATPITVTLTPSQMQTLLGQNHLWSNTGDTSVTYRADTKLYIDGVASATAKVTRQMIADSATADGKAPKSLATGDLIIVGDELRKATANIGNGSAITASNSTTATLADVIKALQ